MNKTALALGACLVAVMITGALVLWANTPATPEFQNQQLPTLQQGE